MKKISWDMPQYEAIKKAYGRFYLSCEKHIEEWGWIRDDLAPEGLFKEIDCDTSDGNDGIHLRPTVLHGIEKNNGWTIAKSIDDLPSLWLHPAKRVSSVRYQACKGERVYNAPININTLHKWFKLGKITHYMQLPPKPVPPIY